MRPKVTQPSVRFQNISPGFTIPAFAFEPQHKSTTLETAATALALRTMKLSVKPEFMDGRKATTTIAHATPMGGNLIVTAAHVVNALTDDACLALSIEVNRPHRKGLHLVEAWRITRDSVYFVPDTDVAFVKYVGTPCPASPSKLLASASLGSVLGSRATVITVGQAEGGSGYDGHVHHLGNVTDEKQVNPRNPSRDGVAERYYTVHDAISYAYQGDGVSGAPVLIQKDLGGDKLGAVVLFGLHFCGQGQNPGRGYACRITLEMLEAAR